MLARRLLLASLGGGTFLDVGYSMSADEITFWQERAALLDPLAYEWVAGVLQTRTVPGGERYYLVNGWNLLASSGGSWFHRPSDINRALVLPAGYTISTCDTTGGVASGGSMYLCKPSLVTTGGGHDSRYDTDPRALYFDRIERLGELTLYQLGGTNTGSGQTTLTLPTDFTYGFVLQTSVHDLAWIITADSGGGGMSNLHNEISDSHGIRWAEPTPFPFTRTVMPKYLTQGVGSGEGRGVVTYCKLPGDW